MITLQINDKQNQLEANPAMPLLWALHALLGLTGTKYSCGIAVCGTCTVLVEGKPVRRLPILLA